MAVFAWNPQKAPLQAGAITVETKAHDATGYHYLVTAKLPNDKTVNADIIINGSIWSPDAYSPFAKSLLSALEVASKQEKDSSPSRPIQVLLNPLAGEIQNQNRQVSEWLTAHPMDAEAHEQASLVIGTLGLRENSGKYWDARGFCNRSTAHLAMAGAIRGDQRLSDAGFLGELIIGLLDDTKADCVTRIEELRKRAEKDSDLLPWINVCVLRNSRDWRVLKDPPIATLLEKIEYFRAYCEAIDSNEGARLLPSLHPEEIADWSRIVLEFDFSVELGHRFATGALKGELLEIARIFPQIQKQKLSPDSLAGILNQWPGGAIQAGKNAEPCYSVIDDGAWALFFQRNLNHVSTETLDFLREKWGVPEEAGKFEKQIGELFGHLSLFPMALVTWKPGNKVDAASREAFRRLLREHTECVTSQSWDAFMKTAHGPLIDLPKMPLWFSPPIPAGTAYCFSHRYRTLPQMFHVGAPALEKYLAIAPLQIGLACDYLVARYTNHPDATQVKEVFGPMLDYHLAAMQWYASAIQDNQEQYEAISKKIARFDPWQYVTLWSYYKERHLDDKAAEAFQAAIDHEADAVGLANYSGWLVNYYYDHGQKDRAMTVARFAAEVYSFRGLEAMAGLMEKTGDLKEAENYFDKIRERYDSAGPLAGFYLRQSRQNPGGPYGDKLKSTLAAVFPNGLQDVALSDFSGKPAHGVLIKNENEMLLKSGLKKDTIIVALDGKRTESFKQYVFVRQMTDSPHMEFIVYQNGKYQCVKAEVPDRKFELDFVTWP